MQTKPLGRSGIPAPRIGLGTATFGREIDEAESCRIIDYALARGINLLDTAEAYGGGEARDYRRNSLGVEDVRETSGEHHSSEKIIGRWLRSNGRRQDIVLTTKVSTNFTREHVRQAVEASLERLQTDYIDLYLFHSYDPNTPLAEALGAMNEIKKSGLVRAFGCSNFSAEQVRAALTLTAEHGLERLEAVESICNLAAREAERDMLPLCRGEQLGFLAYSPLGAGFLAGKYTGDRAGFPAGSRFDVIPAHADVYFSEQNFQTVRDLHAFASRCGIPALRLAFAWVLAHPSVTTVLCGARTTAHIDNAVASLELGPPAAWPASLEPNAV
ncbi:MAG: aldo/keto reductase [Acidobacteria bacterium]|nr:aldo/keto reductase [Acidobacteriota bacterium]